MTLAVKLSPLDHARVPAEADRMVARYGRRQAWALATKWGRRDDSRSAFWGEVADFILRTYAFY